MIKRFITTYKAYRLRKRLRKEAEAALQLRLDALKQKAKATRQFKVVGDQVQCDTCGMHSCGQCGTNAGYRLQDELDEILKG